MDDGGLDVMDVEIDLAVDVVDDVLVVVLDVSFLDLDCIFNGGLNLKFNQQ